MLFFARNRCTHSTTFRLMIINKNTNDAYFDKTVVAVQSVFPIETVHPYEKH
jgi:hypothetical protein